MELHQVLVSAVPGDAITNAALQLQPLLEEIGPSGVYARYIHPDLEGRVGFVDALLARSSPSVERDVIVYHASIGEPTIFGALRDRPERLVVKYHNISPADAFRPYDHTFAALLESGRSEVEALAPRTLLALANSEFSARELAGMGYSHVEVAPLVPDWRRLVDTPVAPDVQRRVDESVEGPVVLFVGQLLPHKHPEFLVHAFHVLVTYLRPDASLVLVGAPRLARYAEALASDVAELNLRRVLTAGVVSDAELAAWYRRAGVFVTASEHEGLCVPLVEAMAFDVPVIARDLAAMPETLGRAGLLLPADATPILAAEAVDRVLGDGGLRDELVRRGRQRLAAFDPAASLAAFRDALLGAAA